MANPVGYGDLFNFSDRDEILQAIRDLRELRQTYKDFTSEVTGRAATGFESQIANLSAEIQAVAKASRELNITNEKGQEALTKNLAIIEALRAENEKLRQAKAGAKAGEDALADSVDGLSARLKSQITLYRQLSKSGGSEAMAQLAGDIRRTRAEINALNDATKVTKGIFNAAAGSYNELDQQTKKLVADLKALEGGMGANADKAKILQAQIFENTAKLKAFDGQMNQNFRNVGNYKSAFDGLGVSFNQLTRELPALGINLQTFFLAISNNLPMLFDEMSKINKANKDAKVAGLEAAGVARAQATANAVAAGASQEAADKIGEQAAATALAAAEGNKGISVFKAMGKALFSLQTFLSVGITLLTLYGSQFISFISSMFSASKAINQLKHQQELLNEVTKEGNKIASDDIAKLQVLYKVATNTTLSITERKKAVDKLQEAYPEYFKNVKDEIILQGKAASAYDATKTAILAAAKTRAIENKLAKLANDELDNLQKKELLFQKQKQNELDKRKADLLPRNNKDQIEERGLSQFNAGSEGTRLVASLNDINDDLAQVAKDREFLLNQITDAGTDDKEKKGKKDHTLEDQIKKMDELIKASTAYRIAQEELIFTKSAQTVTDEIKLETNRFQIIKEGTNLRLKLYKKGSKDYKEILTEQVEAEKNFVDRVRTIRDKDIQNRSKEAVQELESQFKKTRQQFTDELEFEAKKLVVVTQAFDERLKLYGKDSDDYKAILNDKFQAEAAYQAKVRQIREAQTKGRADVSTAQTSFDDAATTGAVRIAVAKGTVSKSDADALAHQQKIARLEDEIEQKQAQLDKAKEGDADYYQFKKELLEKEKELVDEKTDYEIKKAEEVKEKKMALEQAVFDFVSTTAGALFDLGREINQQNIDQLEVDKQKELEIAGNNQDARKKIEEKYAKKTLELKRKQAVYDKLQALFDIGVNAAVGISAALRTPLTAPIIIPFIIATAAIQAAVVAAKPLPKYAKGRGKGKREEALLNEEGEELIENRGRFRIFNRGRQGVAQLESEDIVHTAPKTRNIFTRLRDVVHTMRTGTVQRPGGAVYARDTKSTTDSSKATKSLSERVNERVAQIERATSKTVTAAERLQISQQIFASDHLPAVYGRYRYESRVDKNQVFANNQDVSSRTHEMVKVLNQVARERESNNFINTLLKGTGVVMNYEQQKGERMVEMLRDKGLSAEDVRWAMKSAIEGIDWTMHNYSEQGYQKYIGRKNRLVEQVNERNTIGGNG